MDSLKYTPVGHRVLIEVVIPEDLKRAQSAGIYLGKSIEKESFVADEGRVLAIGKNAFKAFDDGEPWCAVGDIVRVARGSGINIVSEDESVIYRVVNDEDIYAQVNGVSDAI